MFVEVEERVVDSRELFRKFPGHIKQREGMLKLTSIGRKKVKVVDQVIMRAFAEAVAPFG